MNRLVNQLLQVARLDSGILDLSEEFDLNSCAKDVVQHMAPLAINNQRTLAFKGTEQPVLIRGNRLAVEDALRNLIENALIHTLPNTEVYVQVAEEQLIEIRDQGPGVDAAHGSRIFERFFRSPTNTFPGAGLGLAIVSEVMKQHAGTVEYSNCPEGGACFYMKFGTSI